MTAARGGLWHLSGGPWHLSSGPWHLSGGLRLGGYGRARARAHCEARIGVRSRILSPGRIRSRGKLEPQDGHRQPFW